MSDQQPQPPQSSQPPQPPSLWTEDGQPRPAVVTPGPSTSAMAIVGLILAALSFVSCPILFAIVALVLASNATKEIKNSGGRIGGEGLVTATKVLAWINIGIYAAFILIFGAIMLFAMIASVVSGN